MSYFVIVKFDDIPSYGTNPYKCVPSWWVDNKDSNRVSVPYPSKFKIFDDFKNIINREPPIDGWTKYTGTIVHTAESYHEGLRFIHTKDSSYTPEELIFVKYLSVHNKTPRKKSLRKFILKFQRQFCRQFRF